MHPAYSVIFFTTTSGAGYGMLTIMGFLSAAGALPADFWFGLVSFAVALGTVSVGLLSSTFHLGHPERAWRALTQWKSSWLAREGVAAVLTFPAAGLFALGWLIFEDNYGPWAVVGLATAGMAMLTVFCTSMIYGSLKTIHQWHNIWVPPSYTILGVMTGGVWFNVLVESFGLSNPYISGWVLATVVAGWGAKLMYWNFVDNTEAISTPETATGLRVYGRVRAVESPHYVDNYLLREMGYEVARKHAANLRGVTHLFAFALPLFFTALTVAFGDTWISLVASILAGLSVSLGIVVERWLFFAEAKHTVTLFYGAEAV
ncbi:DmsC/YnfH family molybdoenzyme membrane anchor subunit [Magnetospira sp. QH-2]|uniref:dimethyl sulfoxide reductase anchor subunit family protein n=1 Tax=Magnetospira sp. (strain QH-2) TaxID=1288970 RepID=UPI0003E80F0D|nr:DmsC/YnfH family molybdoenzyme membrane anchor subunit [Magnetospira sp. QH-2]CCQ73742.1 DMSO reductase anchor subunit (DmsC) [Magnetospira sp. QH-2]